MVDVATTTDAWRSDVHQQYVELTSGSKFVTECLSYLPDPIKQARLDIPRMSVHLNGKRVQTVNELLRKVAVHQIPIVAALCTQVVFGAPYERAAGWVPIGMFVHEHSPSNKAVINLASGDSRPPYTVSSVCAQKRMRAGYPCHSKNDPIYTIDFAVEVDISTWEYAVMCITHCPLHRA